MKTRIALTKDREAPMSSSDPLAVSDAADSDRAATHGERTDGEQAEGRSDDRAIRFDGQAQAATEIEENAEAEVPSISVLPEKKSWTLTEINSTILMVLAAFYTVYIARSLLFPVALAFLLNLV